MKVTIKVDELVEELTKGSDQLMFTEEDVQQADEPMAVLLRMIFYKKRITVNQFREMSKEYFLSIGADYKKATQNTNNIVKWLQTNDKITLNRFYQIVRNILKMRIRTMNVVMDDFSQDPPEEMVFNIEFIR